MRKIFVSIWAVAAICTGQNINAQEAFISSKLEKVWETPEGLDIPESSHYNTADKIIYVSNIVGIHNVKDNNGYLSKLNDKGEFIVKEWVTGLSAPKGIDCSSSKLYVTDIDRVVEIDLKTGKIIKEYKNAKSKSLNDVSVTSDGRVYISDSEGNCIFYIVNDSLEVFLESNELKSMNGIFAKDNLIYLGSNGNFISVDQKTKEIKILVKEVGYLDGIEQIAGGKFITSDWTGNIQLIDVGKGVEKLMEPSPLKINAADLGYIAEQNLLLVPTFNNNKIVAYKLKL
jgi:outer membrane protein assembly factor BamB